MDELTVAGVWLYRATGDNTYLQNAEQAYGRGLPDGLEWNNKGSAAAVRQNNCGLTGLFFHTGITKISLKRVHF